MKTFAEQDAELIERLDNIVAELPCKEFMIQHTFANGARQMAIEKNKTIRELVEALIWAWEEMNYGETKHRANFIRKLEDFNLIDDFDKPLFDNLDLISKKEE
jgi:hypothetical protein